MWCERRTALQKSLASRSASHIDSDSVEAQTGQLLLAREHTQLVSAYYSSKEFHRWGLGLRGLGLRVSVVLSLGGRLRTRNVSPSDSRMDCCRYWRLKEQVMRSVERGVVSFPVQEPFAIRIK